MFDHLRLLQGERAVKLFLNDDANDIAREKESETCQITLEQQKTSLFVLFQNLFSRGSGFRGGTRHEENAYCLPLSIR